jgi:hypothetical protein
VLKRTHLYVYALLDGATSAAKIEKQKPFHASAAIGTSIAIRRSVPQPTADEIKEC